MVGEKWLVALTDGRRRLIEGKWLVGDCRDKPFSGGEPETRDCRTYLAE
jgi:hypothetical protein